MLHNQLETEKKETFVKFDRNLLEVFYFSQTESENPTLERVNSFFKLIKEINSHLLLCERHYLLGLLFEKCLYTFLKTFPEKKESDWLSEYLQHYINAYVFAVEPNYCKKMSHFALDNTVKQIALTTTLPLNDEYKETLVKILNDHHISKKIDIAPPVKKPNHFRLFKQSASAVGALTGLYFTGGLAGMIGGTLAGYIGVETVEKCFKRS